MIQTNKLLIFPITFMFLVSIFIFLTTAIEPIGKSDTDFRESEVITINGTDVKTGKAEIPSGSSQTFNLFTIGGMLALLLVAVGLGIVASLSFLGSGISAPGQQIIFNSVLFLGMWACLTLVSSQIMFDNIVMSMIYFTVTIMFVIGLGMHMSGGDE